jgi:hypothetical protein
MRRILTVGVFAALAAGLWLGAASCGNGGAASAPATQATSPAEPVALFPADLGSDKIDVTGYPVTQQENYSLFVEKCSVCHTLARVVNAPMVDASTWTRFVKRMHGKNQARVNGGPLLNGEEAKRVISFLVYDSRERKIKRADEFQMQQADLRARFDLAVQERTKKKMEEDRATSRESAPYVGDR